MQYIDPYNHPKLAVRDYLVVGGSVDPDLFHGTIFRVGADQSFTLERLANQIDGAKFFIEVANTSGSQISMTLDPDYRASNLGSIASIDVPAGEVKAFEAICRIGLMIIYDQTGVLSGEGLLNPSGGGVLRNPLTGQPLLNPGN
jgi:hypothetical protein